MRAEQVKTMGYWGLTSFLWDFFKWFFQGDPASSNCGFSNFPDLGLTALAQSWQFDWQINYFGVGEPSSLVPSWRKAHAYIICVQQSSCNRRWRACHVM